MDKIEPVQLVHHIDKQTEGKYYTLGFSVPPGVEQLTVTYRYPSREENGPHRNIVDLGLMDSDGRFLGWSGSARRSITVGEFGSTRGYLSEPIKPGLWSILVGAYRIGPIGIDVTYDITFTRKERRLLFGDLHVHSDASDGQFPLAELGRRARKKGLDFIAAANHNNYAENLALPRIPDLTFVPAVEWTHYRGHMNFFGVAAPFENSFVANSGEEMRAVVGHARALGALISVNHPKDGVCPYLWDDDESFDMVEVWNGPMRGANVRAVAWWTELLMTGRKVPLVGGSDFHRSLRPVRLGNPVTAVMADSPNAADIVAALARGHAFITCSVKGPRLGLGYGDAQMGDTARQEPGVPLRVTASGLRGARLVLVTDRGETPLVDFRGGETVVTEKIKEARFAYIKAVRLLPGRECIRAISNPIYFEKG